MNTLRLDPQDIIRVVIEKSMVSIVVCITTIAGATALALSYFILRLLWTILRGIHDAFGPV